jgi:autotransporter-associated beta strand protein
VCFGTNGFAFGSGIFLQGTGTVTFSPASGQSQTVSDVIADEAGSFGSSGNAWALTKTGAGTLTLTGTNTFSGGTNINGGTLAVSANSTGAASGGLSFDGGTLQYLAGFSSARNVTLNSGGGTFDTNGNSATLAGTIFGTGALSEIGSGTLTLSGTSSYTGATNVNAGMPLSSTLPTIDLDVPPLPSCSVPALIVVPPEFTVTLADDAIEPSTSSVPPLMVVGPV